MNWLKRLFSRPKEALPGHCPKCSAMLVTRFKDLDDGRVEYTRCCPNKKTQRDKHFSMMYHTYPLTNLQIANFNVPAN